MARAIILLVTGILTSSAHAAPSVVSINLCTDQLVLNVAAADQILSLSWLAMDPDESMLPDEAQMYAPNYGTAEEVIRFGPDVVVAGAYTNVYTRALLSRLGFEVLEVDTARSVEDVAVNLMRIGAAIDRVAAARQTVEAMRRRVAAYSQVPRRTVEAVVIRPGGFTIERDSLARDLLALAGIHDIPSEMQLDEWGSLSVETVLRADPDVLILAEYKLGTASLANAWLQHPAIAKMSLNRPTARLPVRYWACGTPQSLESIEALSPLTAWTE
ncbi:MAG: ABC transporter substrate-binding protein [Gammaproteobacteria bacterium]|jgi:iron complex transport system substrate-binding protein